MIRHRYAGGPSNDLSYWGLDYPPLTAYQVLYEPQHHALSWHVTSQQVCLHRGGEGSHATHCTLIWHPVLGSVGVCSVRKQPRRTPLRIRPEHRESGAELAIWEGHWAAGAASSCAGNFARI